LNSLFPSLRVWLRKLEMEDDLNLFRNGRQVKLVYEIEDDHNFYLEMEDDLNCFGKWKTTPIFKEMEDNLNLFGNGEQNNLL
jgi:hypothetical protein